MTFRHWSRVTPYTSPCGLAECYVFAKQSPGPLYLGSLKHGKASSPNQGERLFSRSYEANLPSSLTWFLPRTWVYSTCPPVSVCGTGRGSFITLRRFSRRHGAGPFPPGQARKTPSRLRLLHTAFHSHAPCPLGPADPTAGEPSLPRHAITGCCGSRNVDLESIDYAFLPRLRIRLTLGGRTWPRKPWTFGGADSHRPFRYSCLHDHLHAVHRQSLTGFCPHATLSYQTLARFRGFGCALQSRSFSARHHSFSELLRILQMMAASKPTS